MTDIAPFSGFEEPTENFYRLPNNWFSDVLPLLINKYGNRIAAPLKVLEYILRHTWSRQEWGAKLRLSANEIRNGRKRDSYSDNGTGLADNTIKAAGDILELLGFLIISQDTVDKARRYKTYSPRIKSSEEEARGDFRGFIPPVVNYFILPNNWTDITRSITSGVTIIVVEYAIRHCWGYNNEQGSWMSAEEFANGRQYKTSNRRYDKGTGFSMTAIYRALDDAISRGLMTYAELTDENYYTHRVYNLRLASMVIHPKTGACLQPLPSDVHAVDVNIPTVDADIPTVDDNIPTVDDNIPTVDVNIPAVDADIPTVDADIPAVDADIPTVNADIPTIDVNIRTVEERSLTNTKILNTKRKTPSPPTSRHAPPIKTPGADNVELPQAILAGLEQIGWTDTLTEVQTKYSSDPVRVQAWIDFAINAPRVGNRAGLFRKGIRSSGMPAYRLQNKPDETVEAPKSSEDAEESSAESEIGYTTETRSPAELIADRTWLAVQEQLEHDMPRAQFNAHVKPTRAIALTDNNILEINAHQIDTQEWLDSHVRKTAERLLIGIMNREISIQFVVAQTEGAEQ